MAEQDLVTDTSESVGGKPVWRRIVDFPLVAGVLMTVALIGGLWLLRKAYSPLTKSVISDSGYAVLWGIGMAIVSVAVYKALTPRIGETRRDELPFDRSARDGLTGTGAAFLLMSLMVGIAAVLGAYRLLGWGGGGSFAMMVFVAGIGAAFFEEILMRGVLFRFLEEFGGSWFALALSSALFGFGHIFNPNATALTSLSIAVAGGLMLGGAYLYTRTLWLPIGIHLGWNVTQGFIWDVPVSGNPVDGVVEAQPSGPEFLSGGMFGLEASVIALAMTVPIAAWFIVQAGKRGHLMRPWWVRRRLAREAAATSA